MLTADRINAEIASVIEHGDNRQDIMYLASLYNVRDHLEQSASVSKVVSSGSEFMNCINGKCFDDVIPVLDELMDTLKIINERVYQGVMRKLQ